MKRTKDEIAIGAIEQAATKVHRLLHSVDPGHLQMRKYLTRLHALLCTKAIELEIRCNEESGG